MMVEPGQAPSHQPPDAAEREEPSRSRKDALRANLRTLLPYLITYVIFVGAGVFEPRVMLNWAPGIATLLVVVWVIPALWQRRRPR